MGCCFQKIEKSQPPSAQTHATSAHDNPNHSTDQLSMALSEIDTVPNVLHLSPDRKPDSDDESDHNDNGDGDNCPDTEITPCDTFQNETDIHDSHNDDCLVSNEALEDAVVVGVISSVAPEADVSTQSKHPPLSQEAQDSILAEGHPSAPPETQGEGGEEVGVGSGSGHGSGAVGRQRSDSEDSTQSTSSVFRAMSR